MVDKEQVDILYEEIQTSFQVLNDKLGNLSKAVLRLTNVSSILRLIEGLRILLSPHSLTGDQDWRGLGKYLRNIALKTGEFQNGMVRLHGSMAEGLELQVCLDQLIREVKETGILGGIGETDHQAAEKTDSQTSSTSLTNIAVSTALPPLTTSVKDITEWDIQQAIERVGQKGIEKLAERIIRELDQLQPVLDTYVATCVPAIQEEQQESERFQNTMLTVTTLFSAVAATTLQMSISTGDTTPTMFAVNALWVSSLLFSVGALLNNFLYLAWLRFELRFKTPRHISQWIKWLPAAFLVLAIISFSAGLILFAFASHQAKPTIYFAIAATAITFIAVVGAGLFLVGYFFMRKSNKNVGAA
ncbi:hypothetical protein P691DRAFT_770677 [Macrolepiota fuliginosa MF-IS2]|uniref:Uncharacterized protein n=1 Tax=Macrolepiota fuliginosa MF-IS2 TaxID=1400762 RepID=A0A9P5XR77_9AGAR|nr:hypothetical protein P691DRAFT_770677 [Macrolepiota fuliginosa MF-IS2]